MVLTFIIGVGFILSNSYYTQAYPNSAEHYYNTYDSEKAMYFDDDEAIYYATKAKKTSSSYERYRTIGLQVEYDGVTTKSKLAVRWAQKEKSNTDVSKNEYTLFRIDIRDLMACHTSIADDLDRGYDCTINLKSIMTWLDADSNSEKGWVYNDGERGDGDVGYSYQEVWDFPPSWDTSTKDDIKKAYSTLQHNHT